MTSSFSKKKDLSLRQKIKDINRKHSSNKNRRKYIGNHIEMNNITISKEKMIILIETEHGLVKASRMKIFQVINLKKKILGNEQNKFLATYFLQKIIMSLVIQTNPAKAMNKR